MSSTVLYPNLPGTRYITVRLLLISMITIIIYAYFTLFLYYLYHIVLKYVFFFSIPSIKVLNRFPDR